jgi:hypothetical protein
MMAWQARPGVTSHRTARRVMAWHGRLGMATTSEGRVKAKLRKILSQYDGVYTYWPVPSGYGKTTLDVIGSYRGLFFAAETKREGAKPTLRQTAEIHAMEDSMARVFVIAGEQSPAFDELVEWLNKLRETPNDPYQSPDRVRRRPI